MTSALSMSSMPGSEPSIGSERFALLKIRVRLVREVEWLLAVLVRHDLSQIPHVNESTAERAIAEVLDLGPFGVLAVGASVSWDLQHRSELVRDAAGRWVFPVLDLVPVIAPAGAAGALAVLGD
jgi:hypothetical protein